MATEKKKKVHYVDNKKFLAAIVERKEQLKLFMQYVDKICGSVRGDEHYFSKVEHRFFGRIKKYEDEAYEEWGMIE